MKDLSHTMLRAIDLAHTNDAPDWPHPWVQLARVAAGESEYDVEARAWGKAYNRFIITPDVRGVVAENAKVKAAINAALAWEKHGNAEMAAAWAREACDYAGSSMSSVDRSECERMIAAAPKEVA